MTYNQIKQFDKKIKKTRARIVRLSEQSENTAPQLSHQPRSSAASGSKIENLVLEKIALEERLAELLAEKAAAIESIDTIDDDYMRAIISLRVRNHYSWKRIASLVTGSAENFDTVSKACRRFKW